MGWLELGNPTEAGEELARIRTELLDHPDVLEVRWDVCAATHSWEAGLLVAEKLVEIAPDRASGWLHRAYALRRTSGGGLPAAWDVLLPVHQLFPKMPLVSYNLACYAAQLGRLDEAWDWLHKAMEAAGDVATIKSMALRDTDLEPLRERIQSL